MYLTTIRDLWREFAERCGGSDEPFLTIDELRDEWVDRVGVAYEKALPEEIEWFFDALFRDEVDEYEIDE